MWTLPLLAVLLAAEPVPVAGRPKDFSGAIGGPFVVTTTAEPIVVRVGEPITFTIRITGPGDLSKVQRPDLEHNRDFEAFTIEDGPGRDLNPGREYEYTLRAGSNAGAIIPRVKLVYFNPAIQPAERGFQTTYSESVDISVSPVVYCQVIIPPVDARALRKEVLAVRDRHSWHSASDDAISWPMLVLWGLPPVICLHWFFVARPRHPIDLARKHALNRLQTKPTAAPGRIAAILREFLSIASGQNVNNFTVFEVEKAIAEATIATDLAENAIRFLYDCERAQFGGDTAKGLIERATKLVQAWRASP